MERQPSPGAPLFAARSARPSRSCLANASLLIIGGVLYPLFIAVPHAQLESRQQARVDDALRREGDEIIELADDAMKRRPVPSDFTMEWRNDFFKAQPGTFVPFTITVDPSIRSMPGALMYVRVVDRTTPLPDGRRGAAAFAYETIFPLELQRSEREPLRVHRGFAIQPGNYTVCVVVRERPPGLAAGRKLKRRAAVLTQNLVVPDFWAGGLTTSTVILAERVEPLSAPIPASQLEENPYVIGTSRVYPAHGTLFRRGQELIVVFLIYNPRVATDKHFDVQVDYHLYRRDRDGERYVTRTNPQRFNPLMMGPYYDPASGQPVLAGQGILLSEFEAGDYRLGITVTDLLSRTTVERRVTFTVIGS